MEKNVVDFILAHELIQKNTTILVGVSGGPDSIALLHFLCTKRKEWNLTIHAITVDHQLRADESEDDVEYVKAICKEWDVPVSAYSVDVKSYQKKHKISIQVAARTLRYQVFKEQLKLVQADYLALGHHGDDQIETLVMALMRTTNLKSLTGIPVKRDFSDGQIVRPLLCVTKKEIEHYCHRNDIHPRIDSSNLDSDYTRNDIRKVVVPKLKERNHNLHTTVQMLSETLQEDEDYLMKEAKRAFKLSVEIDSAHKKASLSMSALIHYPLSLQRRVYRLTLNHMYKESPKQLTYMHENIFLSLLQKDTINKVLHFPKHLYIEKSYDTILFYFHNSKEELEPFHMVIDEIPACISLPNGAIVSMKYIDEPSKHNYGRYTYVCLKDQLSFPLHIRTRRPGDRMRYKGLQGSKKIKDILMDEKIPRDKRDNIYIVTDHTDEIFWLIGIRKKEFPKKSGSKPFILMEYKKALTD